MKDLYKIKNILQTTGLPTFNEINEMESELTFCDNNKIGNYRLSTKLLRKIGADKKLTSSALIVLLYFIQIADAENFISDFNYREITQRKNSQHEPIISVKTFYNSIKLLKELGYIAYSSTAYKTRNIRILGNEIGNKETFLNLNHNALVFGTSENDIFLSYSVKAKILFLYLLSRAYSIRKHGSRINLANIMKELQIKKVTFDNYLKKMELLLGSLHRSKNKFTGKRRWTVTVPLTERQKYAPKQHMLEGQANYFDRMFERILSSYSNSKIPCYIKNQKQILKTKFFNLLQEYIHLNPAKIFKIFEYVISESAGLTFEALNHANIILANA